MNENKRDKTKVDPLSGNEEANVPKVYEDAAAKGGPVNACTAEIPGTGKVVRDKDGNELKRVVDT
ncbi:hypothetical protein BH10PLA2_BH10PLA2_07610 [soil metagenome]